jgi:hypothetical protein
MSRYSNVTTRLLPAGTEPQADYAIGVEESMK